MEERWGELEAEFNAAKDAVQLAEEWGVVSFPSAWWNLLLPCQSNLWSPDCPLLCHFCLLRSSQESVEVSSKAIALQ